MRAYARSRRWPAACMCCVAIVLTVAGLAGAEQPTSDRRAPRMLAARMLDTDRDARADRVLVFYSEQVRHPPDRDGRYPFSVNGYRVRSVAGAKGTTLVLSLVERAQPDTDARPSVRYRRTRVGAVTDLARNEAAVQVLRTAPHGGRDPSKPLPPPPTPDVPAEPVDRDGDGVENARDCAPDDPAIRPGASDLPDLSFVDANCDGIDGDEQKAIFVSPTGKDENPGTKAAPKRDLSKAVAVAGAIARDVYVAAGTYDRVVLARGVGIYGGYAPADWKRSATAVSAIVGATEGIYGALIEGVTLQLLSVRGVAVPGLGGGSSYGIRLNQSKDVRIQRVTITAADGNAGDPGMAGAPGLPGGDGEHGLKGACNTTVHNNGGFGGQSQAGKGALEWGGRGGRGGYEDLAAEAGASKGGVGGQAGKPGNPGRRGGDGEPGADGAAGQRGLGLAGPPAILSAAWNPGSGLDGEDGKAGTGGGGGGGGGSQVGVFVINGMGNGGGGGGGAGAPGKRGSGGQAGGGSFGLYAYDSTVELSAGTAIVTGAGGAGGRGGEGGAGGRGGAGGLGATHCTDEIGGGGNGGDGGSGGEGGGGGGGLGGPSIGVVRAGSTRVTTRETSITVGVAGQGGSGGGTGQQRGTDGAPGIVARVYPEAS